MNDDRLWCSSCGCVRKIVNRIITGNEHDSYEQDLEGSEIYVNKTLNLYKDKEVSKNYFGRYRNPARPKDGYAWYVARREVRTVEKMIRQIHPRIQTVLDSPCGTGKLYEMHRRYNYDCVMSDISFEMMNEFIESLHPDTGEMYFVQSNAMKHCFKDKAFDCVIILRLLHRLSEPDVHRVLAEAQRVSAKYMIVSNSMDMASLAKLLQRNKNVPHEGFYWDKDKMKQTLEQYGEVMMSENISTFISSESIFLVKLT